VQARPPPLRERSGVGGVAVARRDGHASRRRAPVPPPRPPLTYTQTPSRPSCAPACRCAVLQGAVPARGSRHQRRGPPLQAGCLPGAPLFV
jgi:hypothetical protein